MLGLWGIGVNVGVVGSRWLYLHVFVGPYVCVATIV